MFVLLAGLFVSSAYAEPVTDGKAAYELSEKERKALTFDVGPAKTTLVQLFTSDANPTCNEAVKWFSSLLQREGSLWKDFVPVAMHVRLWDSSGYRDAFAKDDFDTFVQSYTRNWGVSRVYAPLVVVNGVEWSGWGRGQNIPLADSEKGGTLHVDGTIRPNSYSAVFTPDKTTDTLSGFQLHGVLLSFGLQSRPSDGKNRGNVLIHDFIPILYKGNALQSNGEVWKTTVELPKPRGIQRVRYAVAFWVTKSGNPIPLQGVGGFLPDT